MAETSALGRCLEMSIATSPVAAVEWLTVIAGLLSGAVLIPDAGYGHTLRYLGAARVTAVLKQHSFPACVGPAFIVIRLRNWIEAAGAQTAYIEPVSPWRTGIWKSPTLGFVMSSFIHCGKSKS